RPGRQVRLDVVTRASHRVSGQLEGAGAALVAGGTAQRSGRGVEVLELGSRPGVVVQVGVQVEQLAYLQARAEGLAQAALDGALIVLGVHEVAQDRRDRGSKRALARVTPNRQVRTLSHRRSLVRRTPTPHTAETG